MRSFTGHFITQPLINVLNYRKSVVSHDHQHQISSSEVWTQESMQLRTVCDKRHNIREFWGQNFYRHSTNFLLPTFYVFFRVISKMFFLKSEKNEKYVFSNTVTPVWCAGYRLDEKRRQFARRYHFGSRSPAFNRLGSQFSAPYSIMHRNRGLTGYIGPLILTLTIVRSSVNRMKSASLIVW